MFARIINALLSSMGLALIRKGTLHRLVSAVPVNNLYAVDRIENLERALSAFRESQKQMVNDLLHHQISAQWRIIDASTQNASIPEDQTCPLCGHRGARVDFPTYRTHCLFGGGKLLRYQCPECQLIFGDEKMLGLSAAELSQDYEWHYKVFSEGDSTEQEIRAFHALKPTKEGVYVNWGAGAWSRSIDVLRSEGWAVYGYEPHGSASSAGAHIITSKAQLSDMRFDGIFSNNVLEHLRYPVQELVAMSQLLKPGGTMSHATPCFDYLYEYTRFHLFFYLGRSRELLAEQAQLRVEDYVVDGEFMNLILSRR